jgi:hypothetical protein
MQFAIMTLRCHEISTIPLTGGSTQLGQQIVKHHSQSTNLGAKIVTRFTANGFHWTDTKTKLKDGSSKITGWIYLDTLKNPPSQNLEVKENKHVSTKLQVADARGLKKYGYCMCKFTFHQGCYGELVTAMVLVFEVPCSSISGIWDKILMSDLHV